jgi:hypothetical protein
MKTKTKTKNIDPHLLRRLGKEIVPLNHCLAFPKENQRGLARLWLLQN